MLSEVNSRKLAVLLIEDNKADARLIAEALAEINAHINLNLTTDGEAAMAYLYRKTPFMDAERPDIIILDLNLPGKDGREVLSEIKSDTTLQYIPVVVLTSSHNQQDVRRCYELGANCYITKPVTLDSFTEVMRAIESFWLNVVTLPEE